LSEKPQDNGPWILFAGTPKAHIMFTPRMCGGLADGGWRRSDGSQEGSYLVR
jgi:hypothetical protein